MQYLILFFIALVNWAVISILLLIPLETLGILLSTTIIFVLIALSFSPYSDWLLRLRFRAKPLPHWLYLRIYPCLQEIKTQTNYFDFTPDLFLVNDPTPNAFAMGTRTIVFTTGFLNIATQQELKSVIAHEISHLIAGDSKVRLAASILNITGQAGTLVITTILATTAFISMLAGKYTFFISFPLLIISFLLNLLSRFLYYILELFLRAAGRQSEFAADEFTVRCGLGQGLYSYLSKYVDSFQANQKLSFWARLHCTHPPVEERLSRVNYLLLNT